MQPLSLISSVGDLLRSQGHEAERRLLITQCAILVLCDAEVQKVQSREDNDVIGQFMMTHQKCIYFWWLSWCKWAKEENRILEAKNPSLLFSPCVTFLWASRRRKLRIRWPLFCPPDRAWRGRGQACFSSEKPPVMFHVRPCCCARLRTISGRGKWETPHRLWSRRVGGTSAWW